MVSLAAVAAVVVIVAIPYHRLHRVSMKGPIALPPPLRRHHRRRLLQCRRRRRCFLATQPSRYDNQPHHTNTHPYRITTASPYLTSSYLTVISCCPPSYYLSCYLQCSFTHITTVSPHRSLITTISPISVISSAPLLTWRALLARSSTRAAYTAPTPCTPTR